MTTTSSRPWAIGGVLVALLMVAATWVLVVGPTRTTTQGLDDDTAAVEGQNQVIEAKNTKLAREAEGRQDLVRTARAALDSLPAAAALPDFNRELTRHAKDRGIELVSISVGAAAAPTATDGTTTATGLTSVPITIQTSGPALSQLYFLRDVQQKGPRAALVSATSMTSLAEDGIDIASTLTTQLTVYTAALTDADRLELAAVLGDDVPGVTTDLTSDTATTDPATDASADPSADPSTD